MKKQIIALFILLPHAEVNGCLLGCSSYTETNIPHDSAIAPTSKVQDVQVEVSSIKDAQAETLDASNTEGIGDTNLLDVSVSSIDATKESPEEIEDSNPEGSEPDADERIIDAGTETSKDSSQNSNDSEANTENSSLDADGAIASEASVADGAIASETSVSVRGCALRGHFACWPIREHPTFDTIVKDFVVRDQYTGLHWESRITSSSAYYTFDDATNTCTSKNLPIPKGVTAKWRIPTRLELASILDYSLGGPVLDTRVFALSLDQFWTSSQTPDSLSAWTLTMYQGNINVKAKTQQYYGRCVLDPLGDIYDDSTLLHFDRSTPGQYTDTATLLTWETGDEQNNSTRNLTSAQSYCQGKAWRLPTIKELMTILDDEIVGAPGIIVAVNSELLPRTLAGYYWTDTPVYDGGITTRHWTLHFGTGLTSGTESSAYVRCVR